MYTCINKIVRLGVRINNMLQSAFRSGKVFVLFGGNLASSARSHLCGCFVLLY